MKWRDLDSWEAMIELATRIHDFDLQGYHAISPPTNMVGCSAPRPECVELAIASPLLSGWQCTKPGYVPRVYPDQDDCPHRVKNIGQAPTVQTSPSNRTPALRFGTSERMVAWVTDALVRLSEHPDPAVCSTAIIYLQDLDTPRMWDDLMALGMELVKLCDQEKPWTWTD